MEFSPPVFAAQFGVPFLWLAMVERLNGRVAMVGFTAAVVGEWISGEGITGQLLGVLQWYLNLG